MCHFYLGYAVVVFICLFGATFLFAYKQNRVIFAKKLLISSVISALLSTVVLIPVFLQYLNSMRGGSIFLSLWQSSFFPPIETSLPTFLSLFIVLPFALNFCLKKNLDHLEILFILTLIPVFIEPIAAAWQTYDYMSFPTRYGFITIALGLTLAFRGITDLCEKEDEIKDKNRWLLYLSGIIVTLFCVGFSFFTYNYFAKNKEVLSVYTRSLWGNKDSLIKLFIYYLVPLAFVLLVYCAKRYKLVHKIAVYALIGVLIVIECFFSASVYIVSPSNDYANFSRAFELENVIEDDDFYRVKCNAKNFDVNLVGALGYNSLSHYTSLNRESYMMAIKELGYSSYWMETHSNGGTIFTDALLRNKYTVYLGKKSNADLSTEHFYVMKNDLLFPTAFIIEKNGQNQSDQTLARWQIQDDFFTRLTGKQGLYTPYSITEYSNVKDESTQQQTKLILTSSSAFVEYNFLVSGTQAVYFDCFNVYSNSLKEETYEAVSSVTVTANNRSTKYYSYPTSNKNGTFYLGTFTNTQVKVKIILNKDINYTSFGVFSVDSDLLKNAVNELIAGDFTVEKDFLSGKIIADSNTQALFTSFAYDEGYRAKVNGKKANVFSLNGFLAIELEEGENFVEVDFLPKGFVLSFVIFAFGVCIFILYIVYEKKINAFLEDKKIINKLFVFLTYALGIIVVIMIYLMPVCVNLISYFNYYFL